LPEEAVTESPVPGRSIVTRRAVVDIVRASVLGSYGVIGLSDRRRLRRALRAVGLPPRGIDVSLRDGIAIDLYVTVAHGLPIAEVARQLDSAVRYAVRRAVERDVDRLVVHVNGLKVLPRVANPPVPEHSRPGGSVEPAGPAGSVAAADAGEAIAAGDGVLPLSAFARRRRMLRRSADGRSR
jgi:uncharacterized alkaline shock family protein YloU